MVKYFLLGGIWASAILISISVAAIKVDVSKIRVIMESSHEHH